MNPTGGVLLGLVGVWVLCQVLGGQALQRLGIAGTASPPAPTTRKEAAKHVPASAYPATGFGG